MNIARAPSTFVTTSIPQVPQSMVWTFVRETPEGTRLWNALIRWRRHYEELKNPPPKPAPRKRKTSGKKTQAQPVPQRPVAYFKMKNSYPDCLECFDAAIAYDEIRTRYPQELLAIADELGITEDHPAVQELIASRLQYQLELPI